MRTNSFCSLLISLPVGIRRQRDSIYFNLTGLIAAVMVATAGAQTPGCVDGPAGTKSVAAMRAQWEQMTLEELRKQAESGNAEAAYVLGLQEMEKGREAVKAAFQHSLAAEPTGPVFQWEEVAARWKDVPQEKLLAEVAKQNHEAQYYYGRVAQDEGDVRTKLGFKWLKQAAEQGVFAAQFDVGMFYADRMSYVVVEQDNREAVKWFQRAAKQNHEQSLHQLAELYWEGKLGRPDLVQAIGLLQRCVDLGCHRAEYQLAMLYANGNGEPRHAGEMPAALLEKARLGDVPLAHLELARRYRIGFGVPKNLVRAARHYVIISMVEGYDWKLQRAHEEVYGLLTDDGKPKPNPDPETQRFAEYLAIQTRAIQAREPAAMLQMVQLELANANDERARTFGYFWLSRAQQSGLAAAGPALAQLEKTMNAAELERAKAMIATAAKQENSGRK